jgi:hypothetical protein
MSRGGSFLTLFLRQLCNGADLSGTMNQTDYHRHEFLTKNF